MWKAIKKFAARFHRRPIVASIAVDDQQVTLSFSGHDSSQSFCWRDVDEIRAFKRDLFIVDSIRVAVCAAGNWYEFAEEDVGFLQMVEMMSKIFPSMFPDWYMTVMYPPFETSMMTLWKRSDTASETKT